MDPIEVVKRTVNRHLQFPHGKGGAHLRYPVEGETGDPGERVAQDVVNALARAGHLPASARKAAVSGSRPC